MRVHQLSTNTITWSTPPHCLPLSLPFSFSHLSCHTSHKHCTQFTHTSVPEGRNKVDESVDSGWGIGWAASKHNYWFIQQYQLPYYTWNDDCIRETSFVDKRNLLTIIFNASPKCGRSGSRVLKRSLSIIDLRMTGFRARACFGNSCFVGCVLSFMDGTWNDKTCKI